MDSVSELGKFPGEGNDYPPQYSGLENSMDCIVHGVTKSQTRLSGFHFQSMTPTDPFSIITIMLGDILKALTMCRQLIKPYVYEYI